MALGRDCHITLEIGRTGSIIECDSEPDQASEIRILNATSEKCSGRLGATRTTNRDQNGSFKMLAQFPSPDQS